MFLIGSQAARLMGCLPEWRAGRVQDADLVVRKGDLDWLLGQLEPDTVACRVFPEFPDRTYVLMQSGLLLDVQASDDYADLLGALPDNTDFRLFGRALSVISGLTQLCIKSAYAHLPIHRSKNDRDIAVWREVFDIGLTTSFHQAVADHVTRAAASTLEVLGDN